MKDKKIIIIFILLFVLLGLIIAYVVKNSNATSMENYASTQSNKSITLSNSKDKKEESKTTLKLNSEIKPALVEQIEPHASYYLEEVLIEENQFLEQGANILKYTNGTYLTAPYDCVVTGLNLPQVEGKFLNSHYVEVSSTNILSVVINVDEENINKISIGQEAKITVTTLEKEYTGNVTNVASTGSNGKFKVTIEFENDGSIKLGMTSSVELVI